MKMRSLQLKNINISFILLTILFVQFAVANQSSDDTKAKIIPRLRDMSYFCEETTWLNLKYANPVFSKMVLRNSSYGNHEYINQLRSEILTQDDLPSYDSAGPWVFSRIPTIEARDKIFRYSDASYTTDIQTARTLLLLKESLPIKIKYKTWSLVDIELMRKQNLEDKNILSVSIEKAQLSAACAKLRPSELISCTQALSNNLSFLTTVELGYTNITALDIYKKILTAPAYIEGARLAALKVLDRVEGKTPPNEGNLFSDIYKSYLETGFSNQEADQATWDVIALIATGGPNVGGRLRIITTDKKFDVLKLAISTIAISIPKLDLEKVKRGKLYSLPQNVSTSCEMGKPYHFLLTAYLARKNVQDGFNLEAASAAAYLSQKGYEIISRSSGRSPMRILTTPAFSSWANIIRIDTAYSSTGAIYGAMAAQGRTVKLNIDEAINVIFKNSQDLPVLDDDEALNLVQGTGLGLFNRWQKIVAADSGFDLQMKKAAP